MVVGWNKVKQVVENIYIYESGWFQEQEGDGKPKDLGEYMQITNNKIASLTQHLSSLQAQVETLQAKIHLLEKRKKGGAG